MRQVDTRLRADGTARATFAEQVASAREERVARELVRKPAAAAPAARDRRVSTTPVRQGRPGAAMRVGSKAGGSIGRGAEAARKPLGFSKSAAASKPEDASKASAKLVPTQAQLDALGAGSKVTHKAFGTGTVTRISGGKIYVSFGGK